MVMHWVNNVHVMPYTGELARKVDGDGEASICEQDIQGRLVRESLPAGKAHWCDAVVMLGGYVYAAL